jgi:broad specificity phosphatase PhoE
MEINPELSEINLGDWEGLTATEVKERYPGQYTKRGNDLAYFRPENGESFDDLLDRVLPAFEALRSSTDGTLAVVAHAGVNRVILCHILGVPLANLFRIDQHYGCVNILNYDDNGFRINCINYCPD